MNELVKFFLQLGGHYVDPEVNGHNPSRKLARYQLLASVYPPSVAEALFARTAYPATYPLTDGLIRLTATQRLLDAAAFLGSISSSGIPPYSQCFRARAYDHTSFNPATNQILDRVWPNPGPSSPVDAECVGGALRAVWWRSADDQVLDAGHQVGRGFQPKFLALGGPSSIATMVALFPGNSSSTVESHYWSTPGQQFMTSDPLRFNDHMQAFASNVLLSTRYEDYLNHVVSTVVHTF